MWMDSQKKITGLTQLGKSFSPPLSPKDAKLEVFENPHPDTDYVVRITAPEFTTICPVTSQPDFGTIIVDYCPEKLLIETKSFKMFLFSFRNHGCFHEECTVLIHKELMAVMNPKYLRVTGLWYPRGGMTLDIKIEKGIIPDGCVPLPFEHISYRGGRF